MIKVESKNYSNIVPAGRGEFDVLQGRTNFTIRLSDLFCDYKKWQISGLPCKNTVRCILRMNHKLYEYCFEWFLVERYEKLCDTIIHPISDSRLWGGYQFASLGAPFELRKRGKVEKSKRRESTSVMPLEGIKRYSSGTKGCKTCNQLSIMLPMENWGTIMAGS